MRHYPRRSRGIQPKVPARSVRAHERRRLEVRASELGPAVADVPEDLYCTLDELAAVLRAGDALGKAQALLLDQRAVVELIRPARAFHDE
jgi:hypothetical protein